MFSRIIQMNAKTLKIITTTREDVCLTDDKHKVMLCPKNESPQIFRQKYPKFIKSPQIYKKWYLPYKNKN